MLVVDDGANAPICSCGLRGCLEIFASGASLTRKARALGFRDLAALEQSLKSNDEVAVGLIDAAATAISVAVLNLEREFGVALVVLGGGVFAAIPQLPSRIGAALAGSLQRTLRMAPARVGDDAGVIGAARLAALRSC